MNTSCYTSWNGRPSVLAALLEQQYGTVTRDRVMSYVYSDQFKEKYGYQGIAFQLDSSGKIPLDEIGQEPTFEWIQKTLLTQANPFTSVLLNPEKIEQDTITLLIPQPETRTRPGELSPQAYEDMKAQIKEQWIDTAIANPGNTYTIGYTNPASAKFADNTGFYQRQYAQMLDELREELGALPDNLEIPLLFKYEMNNNISRVAKKFSKLNEELNSSREMFNVDPEIEAEMTAKMEVAVTDQEGNTTGYFLKAYGSNAQVDITDTLLEVMYGTFLANKVKPPSVDNLFKTALASVNALKAYETKQGNQAVANMWEDVRRSFAFPASDSRLSFMSLLLGEFEKRRYRIKPEVKAKLLNKYSKLKNNEVTDTDEKLDGQLDYLADQKEPEDQENLEGEEAKGEATKDWSDSSFELDTRQTASTRTQMWLSSQVKMEYVTYNVLTAPPPGGFYPPDVLDITELVPDPSNITILQALSWRGKKIAHRTKANEVRQVLEQKYSTVPVRNSIGRQSLVPFEDLLGSILDVSASVPNLNFEKLLGLLTSSGNPNLIETARRLKAGDEQLQNELLKVVNLQYASWNVVRVDFKKDKAGNDFVQTKILNAQQYDQIKVQKNKWKEKQLLSSVMRLRADGSRVIDLTKTKAHWKVIEVLQLLNNPPIDKTGWKENLEAFIKDSSYLRGITADMLIEDQTRSLQSKILQTLFAEHGIVLTEEMLKDLTGQFRKNGVMTDKVQALTGRTKLQGNWASQFNSGADGKPKGIFSAFFAKAAGITNVNDIDPEQTEEQEQYVMENNPMVTENTTMGILASLFKKHTPNLHSSTHKTIENKKVWDYSYHTALSNRVDELREDFQAFRSKYLDTVFVGYNNQLGELTSGNWYLDHKDFGNLQVRYFEGANIGNKNAGTVRGSMSDREQLLSVLESYFNNGFSTAHMVSLTHSDKTITPQFSNVPKFEVGPVGAKGIALNVQENFYQMFKGELRRAQHVQKLLEINGTTGNGKLDEGGTKFYLFPMFNREELIKRDLQNFLYNPDGSLVTTFDEANKPLFMELIASFLESEIELERANWLDKGIDVTLIDQRYKNVQKRKGEGTSDEALFEYALKDFTLNSLYWNMSSTILFYGDPAQTFKKGTNETYAEYAKRLAKDIAPGQSLQFKKPMFNSLTVEDVPESLEYLEKLGNKITSALEPANAQELTTVQEHLDVMMALGVISDGLYNELTKVITDSTDGYYEFSKEQLDRMLQPMQPMKPVYTGFREPSNGFMIYDYIKTSSYPLLPQFTKGMEIDKLRRTMEDPKHNIQRVAWASGNKMGNMARKGQSPVAFDSKGRFVETDFTPFIQPLQRKNFRIQQDVPYEKGKEAIKIVSQMNKLIVEGIEDLQGFEVPGYGSMNGRELRTLKENIKSQMVRMNLESFYKKIGTRDGSVDKSKVIKLMIQEAQSRGYSTNEISLLERLIEYKDANGALLGQDFDFPLFLHPAVEKFESLIMSLVKKVTEFKMPGKSYVQASSVGYTRGIVREDKADLREIVWVEGYDGTQPLKHQNKIDGVVQPAQVLAPFNFFVKGVKQSIEDYLIPGTRQLDLSRVPKELLQLVGARIPNQGHNSMIAMEIVGFVPDWMGDTLIVPSAITEQMGSDFDVDKLYTYKRPYRATEAGFEQIINALTPEQERKNFEDAYDAEVNRDYYDGLEDEYRDITLDELDKAWAERRQTKQQVQRDYFNVHWAVLTHPEMFDKVLNKLDKPDLAEANKRYKTDTIKGSFWSSRTQQEMFQTGKDAKALVGLTSLAVTFNSVIQNKELKLGYYKTDKFGNTTAHEKPITVNGLELLYLSGNGKNGEYSKHVNQTIFQSGAVDNAKDRTLDNLNITLATYPAIQAMHQLQSKNGEILGTDFSTGMTVQEIIWRFSKEMRQGNDSLSETFEPKLAETTYERLMEEYTEKYKALEDGKEPETDKVNLTTDLLEKLWKQKDSGNVKSGESLYLLRQIKVLKTFKEFYDIGQRLRELQKTLNQDTNGAGPNMLYANQQQDNFINLNATNNKIFIGEATLVDYTEQYNVFDAVVPTALHIADVVFPFQAMKNVVNLVATNKNIGLSDMSLSTQRDIVRHLRSAILSSSRLISENPTAERFRLLYGTENQDSLAIRLNKYKNKVVNNYFLERLSTDVNTTGKGPDTIKFIAAPAVRMDDALNVSDFMSLINSEDPVAVELGQDLVRYALLFTPQAGPNSFINKVPTAVLLGTRFSTDMRSVSEKLNSSILPGFMDQLYQHKPDLAMELSTEDFKMNSPLNKVPGREYPEFMSIDFDSKEAQKWVITIEGKPVPTPYLRYFDKVENRNILYKLQISEGKIIQYQRIDTLGTKQQTEFDLKIGGVNRSVFQQNRAGLSFGEVSTVFQLKNELAKSITQTADPNNAYSRWGLVEGGEDVLVNSLRQMANDPEVATYLRTLGRAFAGNMKQTKDIEAMLTFGNSLSEFSIDYNNNLGSLGTYRPDERRISLKKTSILQAAAETLVHETIHYRTEGLVTALGWYDKKLEIGASPTQLKAWKSKISQFQEANKDLYNKFKSLDMLRLQALNAFTARVGKERRIELQKGIESGTMEISEEADTLYSLLSMSEFIVGVQTNKSTMKFLNTVESKFGKTLVQRIVDAFMELLTDIAALIGPINDKSILREALELAYHVTNLETTQDMFDSSGQINEKAQILLNEFEANLAANNTNGTVSTNGLSHTVTPFKEKENPMRTNFKEMTFVLDKMDKEIRILESVLSTPARTVADKARFLEATRLHQEVLEDRDTLSSTSDFTQLADIGNKQLNWVSQVLAKDTNHIQEIIMATGILDTWFNMTDLYKDEFTQVNPEMEQMLFDLHNSALKIFSKLKSSSLSTLVSMGSEKGLSFDPSTLLAGITNIAKHKQLLVALSRDSNRLSQMLTVFGQEAANNAQEAQTELRDKIDKMIGLVGKDKEVFQKFIQETEDNSAFGLVQELSPKWYKNIYSANKALDDSLYDIRKQLAKGSPDSIRLRKATWKKFWESMNKHGQVIPVGLLFDMETGERLPGTEEYDKLIEYSGSKAIVDQALEETQIKIKKYLEEKEITFAEFETSTMVTAENIEELKERFTAEEKLLTPQEQQALILGRQLDFRGELVERKKIAWKLKNSPQNFLYTESVIAANEVYAHNGRFKPSFIPKKGDDMFDPKYSVLQADPKLKEAYDMMVEMSKTFRNYLPPKISERLHDNFLPVIDIRDVASMYKLFNDMAKGPGKFIADKVLESMSVTAYERDRKADDEIPVRFVGSAPRIKNENGNYTNEIDFSKLSIDLPRLFEMFGNMAIHYHYMHPIKEMIDVVQRLVINESKERIDAGQPGLNNLSELIQYYKDMLVLKKPIALEGVSAQPVYSSNPVENEKIKRRVLEIHDSIEKLQQKQLDSDDLESLFDESPEAVEITKLRKELEEYTSNARYRSVSKTGDTLIGINQLKAMSYNPFSAVTNFTFGYMSSFIHARGFRAGKDGTTKGDFTATQLRQAYSLMKGNALRSWTVGLSEGELAKKCKAVIDRVGMVEALIDTTYGKTNLEAHGKSKASKALDPFAWQKSGDFMTKGAVVIAMTLNKKVKVTIDGTEQEIPLFEALDNEGKWDTEKYGPNEDWYSEVDKDIKQQEWNKLRDKIRKVGLIIFGNQDRNAPLFLRNTIAGRLVGQFRASWMTEGFNTRFGGEYYDDQLGRTVSGRYMTLGKLKYGGIPLLLQQMASVLTGHNAFEGVQSLQRGEDGKEQWKPIREHEIENMRRNLAGMSYTLAVLAAGLILRTTLPDDEEMKRRRRQGKDNSTGTRILINTLYRMRQDLQLYSNPFVVDQVFGNPIPAWNVVKDALNAGQATLAIAFKEDPDMKKFLLKWTKVFPYLNLVNKLKFYSERDISSAVR
jgi:hypothetical protein